VLFTEVDAVRAAEPNAVNLLASAVRPGDGAGKWMEGMAWRSELCPTYQGYNPCTELDTGPDEGDDGLVYYVPVAYRTADECTLLSGRFDEERVTRLSNAVASFVLAQELWTGALTQLDPYDLPNGGALDQVNAYLANGNATVVSPPAGGGLLAAIAELEEQTRQATRGQQVFLHAPIGMISSVAQNFRRVGNELRTATDAIVVADAGYTGFGGFVPGIGEVQTVTLTGGPAGGTFTLTYSGQTTGNIARAAPAAAVRTALEALSNLAPGDVSVTGMAGGSWTVTFSDELGAVPEMTGSGALLTGGVAPAVAVATVTPGTDPVPAEDGWIYGTGPVSVRLGPVSTDVEPRSTVDRSSNRRKVWADRMFAVTFDPCAHFGMQVPAPA
jgi:hypothetical protein